ncbi:MAG TPA: GNAT family N-acetyltransferase, partial [Ardenticatenaceae bacterium]|nr:GNAT family N-acetyltransferase [Ardenticatenaceae bacterium]
DQSGLTEFSPEGLRSEWEQPGFDLAADARLAEAGDGRIAGYIDVWDMDELPVKALVFGRVHPDFERRGIGTRLLGWAEARSRQAITRVPPEARVAMRCWAPSNHRPTQELFRKHGLLPVRYSWEMGIELVEALPEPNWPEGIAVRTHDEGGDVRAVHRAVRDAFRDHWGHVPTPDEQDFPHWHHRMTADPITYDPSLWFLAMDGEEIAGMLLGMRQPERDPELGWIQTVGVRRPWRQRGLASALLQHAFREFARRGLRRAALMVDAGSLTGATRLYARAGMSVLREFTTFEKELRPGVELGTQSVA